MNKKYNKIKYSIGIFFLLFSFALFGQKTATPWEDNSSPNDDAEIVEANKKTNKKQTPKKVKPAYKLKERKNKRYLTGKVNKDASKKHDLEDKNEYFGSYSLKFTGGFYNYTSTYQNINTGIETTFGLPKNLFARVLTYGFELALRMGHDKERNHIADKKGFNYYRSNQGMFTNIEVGFKTFAFNPGCYQRNDTVYIFDDESPDNQIYCNEALFSNSVNGVGTFASLDGVSDEVRTATGNAASKMNLFYLNTYYTATWINYIMNFGKEYKWFDLSLGPSFRMSTYVDYADPVRALGLDDDNSFATIAVVARLYIKLFNERARLKLHYYYPFYAQMARLVFKSKSFNQDEQTFDVGIDIMAIKSKSFGLILNGGFESHVWKINQNSNERHNQGRPGLVQIDRISKEVYAGLTFEGYL